MTTEDFDSTRWEGPTLARIDKRFRDLEKRTKFAEDEQLNLKDECATLRSNLHDLSSTSASSRELDKVHHRLEKIRIDLEATQASLVNNAPHKCDVESLERRIEALENAGDGQASADTATEARAKENVLRAAKLLVDAEGCSVSEILDAYVDLKRALERYDRSRSGDA